MEKQNDSMRERLLARLPQPENLAAYREETASLLAKHERALFWEKIPSTVGYVIAFAVFIVIWFWGQKFDGAMTHFFWFWAGLAYFGGAVIDLRYRIYRSKVDMLKEVKQVQLQILELQASRQKRSSE
ncbi:hypothetical protein [Acidicapsa acidisoli]|uniref:hypothetical protein n=1 Tax=Acidicapsa acidisoli TaxID=1615681 RepID=UPI0021E0499C|nr:hypothetical protein [Acidicapsa acidisoli]